MPYPRTTVRSRRFYGLSLLIPLLLLAGCAYFAQLAGLEVLRPKVSLRDLSIVGYHGSTLDLRVGILVENPNGFDLNLASLRYGIDAAGLALAQGDYDQPLNVPGHKAQTLTLPVRVATDQVLRLVSMLLTGKQPVTAHLSATAAFATTWGNLDVPFSADKPLSLPTL